ncbi:MAG: hypothetical protein WKF55_13090 [Gemmatimonadaceae bacterium]
MILQHPFQPIDDVTRTRVTATIVIVDANGMNRGLLIVDRGSTLIDSIKSPLTGKRQRLNVASIAEAFFFDVFHDRTLCQKSCRGGCQTFSDKALKHPFEYYRQLPAIRKN